MFQNTIQRPRGKNLEVLPTNVMSKKILSSIEAILEEWKASVSVRISEKFDLDVDEVKGMFDEPVAKSKINQKSIDKSKSESGSTCDFIPRGKNERCGKKAVNKVGEMNCCGRYKDDGGATGHLKAVIASESKKTAPRKKPPVVAVEAPKKKSLPPKKTKGETLATNAAKSEEKVKKLVDDVVKIDLDTLELQSIGDRRMDMRTRILFDSKSHAYGKLDETDLELILPLSEEDKVFLERMGIEEGPIPMVNVHLENEEEEVIEIIFED
jgi:hypothetical protein